MLLQLRMTMTLNWLLCLVCLFDAADMIKGQSDIGYFWHVTDFHYDHTYSGEKLSCNDQDIPSQLPAYGDYWCDATWKLVMDSINAMATIKPDVDFLIWTGDTVAHISDDKLSLELTLEVIQNLTNALSQRLGKVPVYASLGNHDFYPNGQASPVVGHPFYSNIADMWQDWVLNQSKAIDDSRQGGYYAVKVSPNVRLLALNTNLYYKSDKLTPNVPDPVGQFAWMQRQLQEAKSTGEKVILTGHVPPGLPIPEITDWYWPVFKTKFMDILFNYTDIIVALHFGHDHYDSFKILQSVDGTKAVPQFNAPAVTPWRHKVKEDGVEKVGEPHNPGLRLIKYNRSTGAQLDYAQYFINITKANAGAEGAVWRLLYNFTSTYGVSDMSVDSVKSIFKKMEDNSSPLYQKFCNNWVVSDLDKKCTDDMRANVWCGGQHYILAKAQQCSKDRQKASNDARRLTWSASLIFFLCLLFSTKL
ncbi:acid sphingomyelinase-like phosphodiesterase 3b [Biomphalaria glabrata]|uniref:Acid sphingomyelinase-like phosphodiesterase 3b n=1 Tax=Biomphalaria glabrata TaxID=6526 RepID=A0A9W3AHN3_BIOGL|nr:acid sphingomyelinase-like phosphodiesterase 3b [Biomphalaria glabrata]